MSECINECEYEVWREDQNELCGGVKVRHEHLVLGSPADLASQRVSFLAF